MCFVNKELKMTERHKKIPCLWQCKTNCPNTNLIKTTAENNNIPEGATMLNSTLENLKTAVNDFDEKNWGISSKTQDNLYWLLG